MMKYAKIITLLLAVLMVLSLSACGKKMSQEEIEEACVKARPSIVPSIQSGGLMSLKGMPYKGKVRSKRKRAEVIHKPHLARASGLGGSTPKNRTR